MYTTENSRPETTNFSCEIHFCCTKTIVPGTPGDGLHQTYPASTFLLNQAARFSTGAKWRPIVNRWYKSGGLICPSIWPSRNLVTRFFHAPKPNYPKLFFIAFFPNCVWNQFALKRGRQSFGMYLLLLPKFCQKVREYGFTLLQSDLVLKTLPSSSRKTSALVESVARWKNEGNNDTLPLTKQTTCKQKLR